MNIKKLTLRIAREPIVFSQLEVNASFSYDVKGTELLAKASDTSAYHLNMQKEVNVHLDTPVHRVIW